ncbi:SDR family oxidoreductase [Prolixibacteraceae bacterium JC049]|nr:SDR family oxidoreductase [Prolixibacteraceae bacterium JC049]
MKNIVIIGGSSGIGKALVDKLEQAGNSVWTTYRSHALQSRANVNYQQLDVMSGDSALKNMPEEINGFVYCPGSINLKPFKRFNEDDLLSDFRLQVLGAVSTIQQVLPNLKKGNAAIVLFSTIAVQVGLRYHSQVAISKGAIEGLTKALAAELAPHMRVNAIAPSLTDTDLAERFLSTPEKKEIHSNNHPLKRIGQANDIANAVEFLLSDKSSWVTGQIIAVDGGYSTLK